MKEREPAGDNGIAVFRPFLPSACCDNGNVCRAVVRLC
jgi:hypothetical protein